MVLIDTAMVLLDTLTLRRLALSVIPVEFYIPLNPGSCYDRVVIKYLSLDDALKLIKRVRFDKFDDTIDADTRQVLFAAIK